MHCVGQFTWCWSLWGNGDHPSQYFISSLTLSHRCTHVHAPTCSHTHTHSHVVICLCLPSSLPLFCGPVLSRLLFRTAAASIKQLQTELCCGDSDKQGGYFRDGAATSQGEFESEDLGESQKSVFRSCD